ncbi:MAG: phosphonate ABC transporter ATP-binding protein [Deltaproteobacteria bacterium]|nr:phosphonate ABC transporter ATP-binding protein [Deltaproteobacteria bacterium]
MISLNDVSMVYPNGFIGLHPLSIEFHPGQFTVLIGTSGAGKSTLLRCLNFLNRPSTGTVKVEGLGCLGSGTSLRRHRRRTAMVFQQHQLIGRHSALKNALVGRLGYHHPLRGLAPLPRADQRLALECLERVGLLDKAFERVDKLSGGQQQRVGIARALVQKPRIILADEPVASLDPATSDNILSLLHRICVEDGILAIVSLHQVELARRYADRVLALAGGRLVFDGPPRNLCSETLEDIYNCTTLAA